MHNNIKLPTICVFCFKNELVHSVAAKFSKSKGALKKATLPNPYWATELEHSNFTTAFAR
jgi:hypothetical protein